MLDVDNKLIVIDENGNEKEMQILFTFDSKDYQKNYVLFFDPNAEEEIFASSYSEGGELNIVEDEKEWAMINEVLEAFLNEEEQEEE